MNTPTQYPRPTILPPNASALMRAVDQAVPQWDALPGALRGNTYGHTDELAPWLAGEWGLAQFARYFNGNTGQLLQTGVPWLRERGTPAAVRRALGWLGFTGVTIQEDGARLHIDPGQNVTAEQVCSMAHVVRASIPAHVDFYRVFHGLDVRPFVWGRSRWGHAVYQDESGTLVDVDPWGNPISVSQRTVTVHVVPKRQRRAQHLHTERVTHKLWRFNTWRWGFARYGHNTALRFHPQAMRVDTHVPAVPARPAPALPAQYQWRDLFGHPCPPRPHLAAQAMATTTHALLAPAYLQPATWRGRWDTRTWRKSLPSEFKFLEP